MVELNFEEAQKLGVDEAMIMSGLTAGLNGAVDIALISNLIKNGKDMSFFGKIINAVGIGYCTYNTAKHGALFINLMDKSKAMKREQLRKEAAEFDADENFKNVTPESE